MTTLSAAWVRRAGLLVALPALVLLLFRVLERFSPTPIPQLAAFTFWAIPLWVVAGLLLVAGGLRLVAAFVVVALALQLWWLAPPRVARATARSAASGSAASGSAASGGADLTVMTQNVELGGADAARTFALVQRHDVDVLLIEELTPAFAARLQAAGIGGTMAYSDLMTAGGAAGTGIWSRWPLQADGSVPDVRFSMPRAEVAVPGTHGVLVTAVHTVAPRPSGGGLGLWRHDLSSLRAAVAAQISSTSPSSSPSMPQVVAGDFNATRDHAEFRAVLATGLTDAGDAVSVADWPGFTWPADEPGPAGARLDHVLITPASIGVRMVRDVSVPDTDHHGVIADLVVTQS